MPEISNPLPDHIELAENKFFTKKSIITFLMIGIVLLAIPFSVKYLQQTNILKTRATGDEITFIGDNISCDEAGVCKATDTKFQVLLKSPLGPPGVVLPSPQNLEASCSANNKSVTLTWDAISDAASYIVRINKDPQGDWKGPGDDAPTITTASLTQAITPGINYTWATQVNPNTGPFDRRTEGAAFTCGTPSTVTPTSGPTPTTAPAVSLITPVPASGCTANYSLNPVLPGANANVTVSFPTVPSSPNVSCVVLYQDGAPQACQIVAPNNTLSCTVNSGASGSPHLLQLMYGQDDVYKNQTPKPDCKQPVVCNSKTYTTGGVGS
ncbi:MAG: hypothetical protein Q7R43_00540 [Candidatus Daviesbacteria bacterium]|nr:hypothetical protein [Candidatus Daviesbacteria bacterium]